MQGVDFDRAALDLVPGGKDGGKLAFLDRGADVVRAPGMLAHLRHTVGLARLVGELVGVVIDRDGREGQLDLQLHVVPAEGQLAIGVLITDLLSVAVDEVEVAVYRGVEGLGVVLGMQRDVGAVGRARLDHVAGGDGGLSDAVLFGPADGGVVAVFFVFGVVGDGIVGLQGFIVDGYANVFHADMGDLPGRGCRHWQNAQHQHKAEQGRNQAVDFHGASSFSIGDSIRTRSYGLRVFLPRPLD